MGVIRQECLPQFRERYYELLRESLNAESFRSRTWLTKKLYDKARAHRPRILGYNYLVAVGFKNEFPVDTFSLEWAWKHVFPETHEALQNIISEFSERTESND